MPTKIKLRRDLDTTWSTVNPILDDGEMGYERNTGRFKIGNGALHWNDLPYKDVNGIPSGGTTTQILAKASDDDYDVEWIDASGGGGVSYDPLTVKTKAEIDALITTGTLIPGQSYKITGVDTSLYGGTDIIVKATSTMELSYHGVGLFYNPKYEDHDVWSNTNTYAIGDIVSWGGKHWTNLNGNVGTSSDIFTLNNEWELIPYDNVNYNQVWDRITYNYAEDRIDSRKDNLENYVSSTSGGMSLLSDYSGYADPPNPIKAFQWGVGIVGGRSPCSYNNKVIDSYLENINCIFGSMIYNNFLIGQSAIFPSFNGRLSDNQLSGSSVIATNVVSGYPFIINNILQNASRIDVYNMGEAAYIENNHVCDYSYIKCSFSSGGISNCNFNNTALTLTGGTPYPNVIRYNDFKSGVITADLSAATLVYGDYQKTILKREDGTVKIIYLNNSNVMQVADLTD